MLFDLPLLPGLDFREELIGPVEEAALIAEVERTDLSPFRFQGWTGRRLTKTYGWRYDFDDRSFQPVEDYRAPEWPSQSVPQQMHLDVQVDDLDKAEAAVLELGATKHEHQPGTTFRVFLDPAGHPFCLCLD